MLKIREVKTASSSIAVQVIYYSKRKRVVLKHVGSARDELELETLKHLAVEFIKDHTQQLSVFPQSKSQQPFVCQLHPMYWFLLSFLLRYYSKTDGTNWL
jgi:ATP-dependent helicase/DNAse subunit B